MTIIPMKRRFLITPLKMFFSSGFRALNSLNACQNQKKKIKLTNALVYMLRPFDFSLLTWQRTKALKIIVFFTLVACVGTSCSRPSMLMPRKLRSSNTLT